MHYTYPVAFSNMPRAPSVIFSFTPRSLLGSILPPPNFFSTASRPVERVSWFAGGEVQGGRCVERGVRFGERDTGGGRREKAVVGVKGESEIEGTEMVGGEKLVERKTVVRWKIVIEGKDGSEKPRGWCDGE